MRLVFPGQHEVDDGGAGDAVFGDDEQLACWRVRRAATTAWRMTGLGDEPVDARRADACRSVLASRNSTSRELRVLARWPRPARPAQPPRALAIPRTVRPSRGRFGGRRFGRRQLGAQRGILGDDVLVRRQFRLRPRDRRDLADRFEYFR